MLLIRTKDGLAPWRGEPLTRMVAERTVHYLDGRSETESCEPYPLAVTGMAPGKVEALIRDGVWGANDLADHGLSWAAPFVVPDGKRIVGEPRYEEQPDGSVVEVYEVEDIPPPPPPPTAEQKLDRLLADYGLTREELVAALAPADQEAKA